CKILRRKRASSVLGSGGIFAYLGFIGGRPDGLRGISPFMPLFQTVSTMSRLRIKTRSFSNTHFPIQNRLESL
ncbi:hypothetical protein, partial [Haemophilus haemolyticus]|uniref:hypothetical protein n=1 Tax=Haemophilus haemolyticus TaxID=726 RepID=UPI001EFEB678